jgi:hypothetical protein
VIPPPLVEIPDETEADTAMWTRGFNAALLRADQWSEFYQGSKAYRAGWWAYVWGLT